MEPRDILRRFWLPLALTGAVVVYGTAGYALIIPGATLLDGLYWTVLTLGGVGFRDTQLSGAGAEVFSITLIVGLLVAVVVTAAIAGDLVASGDLARAHRRRRMKWRVEALQGHFILCGFGRVGRAVVNEYRRAGVPVIVIELDPAAVGDLEDLGLP